MIDFMALNEASSRVRGRHKAIKDGLRAETLGFADALELDDAAGLYVWRMVRWLPRFGDAKIHDLDMRLYRAGVPIHHSKRVAGLTAHQKATLICELAGMPWAVDHPDLDRLRIAGARCR